MHAKWGPAASYWFSDDCLESDQQHKQQSQTNESATDAAVWLLHHCRQPTSPATASCCHVSQADGQRRATSAFCMADSVAPYQRVTGTDFVPHQNMSAPIMRRSLVPAGFTFSVNNLGGMCFEVTESRYSLV
jgi:hypothetical protein